MPNKPKTNQPATPEKAQSRDCFATPNYATDLLIPFIPKPIRFVWECACGEGRMVRRLEYYGFGVLATDIRYNDTADMVYNFLTDEGIEQTIDVPYAIITNPPYSLKKQFFERCMYYEVPFALLIPADYSYWICNAVDRLGCQKIIPYRRVNYITPSKKEGKDSSAQFHSLWLTHGFNLREKETYVELSTKEIKENI